MCHGTASDEQMVAVREILRTDALARDEYLLRVSLHACLASEPELFAGATEVCDIPDITSVREAAGLERIRNSTERRLAWARTRTLALAAGIVMFAGAVWWFASHPGARRGETSRAVAMLNRAVNADWGRDERAPRLGAPLEPGPLRLDSGLAQIVFYNGARVVIEGPAELKLISSTELVCASGTLTAEVPPQARGFRIVSPRFDVTDLGTIFGMKIQPEHSELHVFEGRVEFHTDSAAEVQRLGGGRGAVVDGTGKARQIDAERRAFAHLFDLQAMSVAAEARRYDQWREFIRKLRLDPTLWVHFDFEHGGAPAWRLPNTGSRQDEVPDATIVGCQWRDGRWSTKPALEFGGVSDRVRVTIPGELESATLAAWVRVQGLDRQINSLFMSDGFLPGTLHWVLRNDGVLGLTVIGRQGDHQILASPPVITFDQFGIWTHLAVVLDGRARQVVHYVNGRVVSRHSLRVAPPFRCGPSEVGNWNAHHFKGNDPFLIRNFSGAIDEFCLFARPLSSDEIAALHSNGKPQPDTLAATESFRSFPAQPVSALRIPCTP